MPPLVKDFVKPLLMQVALDPAPLAAERNADLGQRRKTVAIGGNL
jgi:hypothetical protein